jgi:seryl-tRNA synthetase
MAAQERWLEVSSVSNFETFQTNRLKLRYRDENNQTQLLHTLNGSSLAKQIVAALLENNQTPEELKFQKCCGTFSEQNTLNDKKFLIWVADTLFICCWEL